MAVSPDGKLFASGGRDHNRATRESDPAVTIWDAETGNPVPTLKGHLHWMYSLDFSPDGKRLLSAGGHVWTTGKVEPFRGGDIKVWDAANGKLQLDLKVPDSIVLRARFSGDGKRFVSTRGAACRSAGEIISNELPGC